MPPAHKRDTNVRNLSAPYNIPSQSARVAAGNAAINRRRSSPVENSPGNGFPVSEDATDYPSGTTSENESLPLNRAPRSLREVASELAQEETLPVETSDLNIDVESEVFDLEDINFQNDADDINQRFTYNNHPASVENSLTNVNSIHAQPTTISDMIDLTDETSYDPRKQKFEQGKNPSTTNAEIEKEEPSKKQVVPSSQRLADYKCVICLDSPENLSCTPCGHIFCNFCILSALGTTAATQKCPVCRRKVHPNKVICLEMMLGSQKKKS
ncbi:E3 ubiquitin-protein ligase complex slx8-rfp subunit slx8 [Schizosaccharomyces pombe]|uniref:E3 ubiquitin-protein ligase complex slx8-rfp subunit slx8 n=1 Tax=Schizosaccharomyces pombe (strain 972 / ATCC 24843) TaxID=284812 RepID=SLX8_SCHPO|nr:putative SUMO-targeted ubiquitin-protein ligase E3 Slx8 [Schizosaccharomyces pombe]P87176.1 RecName: Full=E3 ubiquitin-protein ligase complex slx8-rfp subunit slx8; AltName: Full=RING finger protein slx8; AltName: Full=RING-dependent E3 ubiquitin-protein ligase slx8; AltName: Full=RING-type E3 ubiquitin transferase slx8; AltName: Full=Synthetic lethal of unknown function protein 8 [Schizosaccharomyces pombe 972h-]CAB09120.1 SUMO-targeted ubiquitin-protein ligase E3 Slx8 (predicted) [Schizosacc|eukprot:NP_595523.1 putative SUMO-targeted ubiquitin-protein ligase E3 Slx8 [Schizosaccharomyces pombe]